jgi:hypothetical protein
MEYCGGGDEIEPLKNSPSPARRGDKSILRLFMPLLKVIQAFMGLKFN